jgi:Hint domain
MALFFWTHTPSGDWSDGANWTPVGPALPTPGPDDIAFFGELPSNYTVNVTTLVGVEAMIIDPTTPFTGDPTFSISGSLTTEFLDYATAFGGPATSMTINAGGSLDITTALASIRVPETITIAGGELVLGSSLVGDAGSNVSFDFENTAGPNGSNTGVIQIDATGAGPGGLTTQTIGDVANGDKFVLPDENFFPGSTVALTGNVLTVLLGGIIPVFTMENISLAPGFTGTFLASGDVIQAVCYARGTMIRTPAREVAVEKLRPGMQVITLNVDGNEVPRTVKWVGHRRIDLTRHPRPETVAPIRIVRDAFADNVPHTDLLLSPDHAVLVDGMLVCIRQLVNGATIRPDPGWTAVDYYHVELDEHAILVAEGLTAESYVDTGNRGFFANSGGPLTLYPDMTAEANYPTREAGSCAPFVWDEVSVQPIWQRLADRAAAIGQPVSQRTTTTDTDLRLLTDQRTVTPVISDSDRVIFVLPRGSLQVRLASRAQSPTEARPWLDDRRRLGVRVKRIVLRGADELREIPVDHPDLSRGWWAVERDGQLMSRWTNGEAVLPLPEMSGHVMLEIHLAGSMIYAVDTAPEGGMEQRVAA